MNLIVPTATVQVPDWVAYPDRDWVQIMPAEAGLDARKFAVWLASLNVRGASFGGEDHSGDQYGAVLTRGGYLVHAWGDRHYRHQTASVGKALTWVALGAAVGDGLLDPDEPIHQTWTGAGQLSHEHKYLDCGHHQKLTWRHLIGRRDESLHWGGFPFEIGIRWREKRTGLEERDAVSGVPEWANWTGDPFCDCYAHAEPGTQGLYSSAGFWRLGQALTYVWGRDLKDVVQERLFDAIGIPYERWDWLAGGSERAEIPLSRHSGRVHLPRPTLRSWRPGCAQRPRLGGHQRLGSGALRPPQCHPGHVEGGARHQRRLAARPQRGQ